jgi:hypothetical protein
MSSPVARLKATIFCKCRVKLTGEFREFRKSKIQHIQGFFLSYFNDEASLTCTG